MTNEELLSNAALKSWKLVLGQFDKGLAARTDEQLQQPVAPGKNRVFYLLGHLTAVHDRLLPMLFIGERLHPELDETYITNPDKALSDPVSAADLRKAWSTINAQLTAALENFTPQDWLRRHSAASDTDFAADPTRNRLAVVLSRTNHLSFHTGQIVLTK
jgi:hypothetical protein